VPARALCGYLQSDREEEEELERRPTATADDFIFDPADFEPVGIITIGRWSCERWLWWRWCVCVCGGCLPVGGGTHGG
jgi:hypothetical protein